MPGSGGGILRPLALLALPGMYLVFKYNQYRHQQMESSRRRVTERELMHLNTKIDKLLNKLEENEPELAASPEEECVICVNAKATMQTSPCGHRVVCRRCFVKTIQMAVAQRLLPLRCVICRAKILKLRQARIHTSRSWQATSGNSRAWCVPGSVSSYSVGARPVPASASLYSVTSGESSISGISSVSSNSGGAPSCAGKVCGGARCGGVCLGAVPRAPAQKPPKPTTIRRPHNAKVRLQEHQVYGYASVVNVTAGGSTSNGGSAQARLPPIREFQRDFREGRRESSAPTTASSSTRIRCAQKIVTQLEISPQKKATNFFRKPLLSLQKEETSSSRDGSSTSRDTPKKKETPKTKTKKDDKKKNEEDKKEDSSKLDQPSTSKKSEAERKKEEKLKLKAEKEAKKEAKLLAKEEEKQAKLLAKEEKKKAKKEAKLALQAEKEKNKESKKS